MFQVLHDVVLIHRTIQSSLIVCQLVFDNVYDGSSRIFRDRINCFTVSSLEKRFYNRISTQLR